MISSEVDATICGHLIHDYQVWIWNGKNAHPFRVARTRQESRYLIRIP